MKKKLNIAGITNELEGASLFFPRQSKAENEVSSPPTPEPVIKQSAKKENQEKNFREIPSFEKPSTSNLPSNRDTTTPRYHETMVSRHHDTTPEIIEAVRKAAKEIGKEAATHRFTLEEKKKIADIIYTYKTHGVKTSENEIARIAVNFLIEDYKQNGETSILEKVLKALKD